MFSPFQPYRAKCQDHTAPMSIISCALVVSRQFLVDPSCRRLLQRVNWHRVDHTAMPYLAHISLLVRDYDEAISFYTRLGFELVEDTFIPAQQKRWVVIRPPPTQLASSEPSTEQKTESFDKDIERQPQSKSALASSQATTILLARPSNAEQEAFIGNQAGGRVFLFLATDDFERDFKRFSEAGVEWVRPPKTEAYGKVAVWKDLYGNLWDLIEHL